MQKPKILIMLFRLPYPITDGTRHKILNNLVAGLSHDFDIEFFISTIENDNEESINYIENKFGKVHRFQISKINIIRNIVRALFSKLPLQAELFQNKEAKKWLRDNKYRFDAFYVHEIRMTEYVIDWSNNEKEKILVDFNDAISMNYDSGVNTMKGFKKIFYKFEGKRVKAYESEVLQKFSHFNIVSPIDRNMLLKNLESVKANSLSKLDFQVIPHGVEITDKSGDYSKNSIYFIGNLNYAPNRDALDYFLKTIWPTVTDKNKIVDLMVVGGGKILPNWIGLERVTFTGSVPEVFEVIHHCRALVAPIRYGGGTPSKILEAMGYGIPVITTKAGISGIPEIEPNKHVLVVEDDTNPDSWCLTIEKVINNIDNARFIGKAGKELIRTKYTNNVAREEYRNRFLKIIQNL